MNNLSRLSPKILDWFDSDEISEIIGDISNNLSLSDEARSVILSAIYDIETGVLHPNKLLQWLKDEIPSLSDNELLIISDTIIEKIIQPVLNDLATIHEYKIDSTIPTEKITNTSEEEPLKDPLDPKNTLRASFTEQSNKKEETPPIVEANSEENQDTPPITESQSETISQKIENNEIIEETSPLPEPFTLKDPLETSAEREHIESVSKTVDTYDNKIQLPPAPFPPVPDITSIPQQDTEPTTSKKPRLFKNLASLFSNRNKNPLTEDSSVTFDNETIIPTPKLQEEENYHEVPLVPTTPPFPPVSSHPTADQNNSLEDILMAHTINLADTNPEIEAPTTITVGTDTTTEDTKETLPDITQKGNEQIEPSQDLTEQLKPVFSHIPTSPARPFILHEEKEDEQIQRPSFTSYDTIKPSFYRPSFAETTPAPARQVSARLEFGDAQQSPDTPVNPTTTEKSKPRVIHYSSLKTETPFGNPFGDNIEAPPQPVHPNNILDLREKNTLRESDSDIHPNNIVNLKDLPK